MRISVLLETQVTLLTVVIFVVPVVLTRIRYLVTALSTLTFSASTTVGSEGDGVVCFQTITNAISLQLPQPEVGTGVRRGNIGVRIATLSRYASVSTV